MKRININIEEDIHSKFKSYCAGQKDTMTRIIIELIKKEIDYEQEISK